MDDNRVTVMFIVASPADGGLTVQLEKGKLIKQFAIDWTPRTPADKVLELINRAWKKATEVLERDYDRERDYREHETATAR